MKSGLEQSITEFEKEYSGKMKRWAGFVDPGELDELMETLNRLDQASNAITNQFESRREALYVDRWQPLLKNLMGLIPNIEGHLQRIRSGTRQNMGALGKGQRGLVGYRSSMNRSDGDFERNA